MIRSFFRKAILLAALCQLSAIGYAQTTTPDSLVDIIYLKDGSRLVGKVITYKREEKAVIETAISPQAIEIDADRIERVALSVSPMEAINATKPAMLTVRQPRPRLLNQEGWYSHIEMLTIFRNPSNDGASTSPQFGTGSQTGIGISYTFGYQKHRHYSFGAGLGYYTIDRANYVPVYLETQGYFQRHSFTPFYSLRLGYGFLNGGGNNWNNAVNMTTSNGGLYARPTLGFRYASKNRTHFTMSLGLYLQKAYIERTWNDWQTGTPFTTKDNIFYRRLSLNFGMLLSHK